MLIALGIVFAGAILWNSTHVLLILFAGILFATLLSAVTDYLSRWTRLPHGWSLAIGVLLLLLIVAGLFTLVGARIAQQAAEMAERIPQAISQLYDHLKHYQIVAWLEQQQPSLRSMMSSTAVGTHIAGYLTGLTTFLIEFVIVLAIGLFIAAQPDLYKRGVVSLLPERRQALARELLDDAASTLRWWLLGRILSMIIIGTADGVAMWLLGVPLPLTLGVISGLLTFIPNIGPIIAAVPAVLLALTVQGQPWLPLWVVLAKFGIQMVESYVITPLVQQRTIYMPPALTLSVQFLLGTLAGLPGLALAVPLTAVVIAVTRKLREWRS